MEPKADSPITPKKCSALELEPAGGATGEPAQEDLGLELATHNRYSYSAITQRDNYSWPGGKRLAVYFAINLEHFEFGKGMGAKLGGQCARLVPIARRDMTTAFEAPNFLYSQARCCCRYDECSFGEPDVLNYSWRDYGARKIV
jgi:hypothetical protein